MKSIVVLKHQCGCCMHSWFYYGKNACIHITKDFNSLPQFSKLGVEVFHVMWNVLCGLCGFLIFLFSVM